MKIVSSMTMNMRFMMMRIKKQERIVKKINISFSLFRDSVVASASFFATLLC